MWIKSIRINNFGKLHGVEVDFGKGINSCIKHNGWGKSTIAAFIRVMFYGLEGDKTRDTVRNERRRYRPWQGGVFGGSMDIEWEGKSYTIFRTFGNKPIDDEMKVMDNTTGLPSEELGFIPGETIFGIDSEGFRRTAFIGQSDCPTSTNDSVNARLGDLSNKEFDINKYEAAIEKINTLKSNINPSGRTFSAKKDKEQLQEMEVKIRTMANLGSDIESMETEVASLKATDAELEKELLKLEERRETVSKEAGLKTLREKYDWFLGKREEIQASIDARSEEIPQSIPTLSRIDEIGDAYRRLQLARENLDKSVLDEESQSRWDELESSFHGKEYDSNVTSRHMDSIKRDRAQLEEQERGRLSSMEETRLAELTELFNSETDTTDRIENLIDKCDDISSRRAKLAADSENLKSKKDSYKPKRAGVPTVIIIGVLLLIMSGAFFTSNNIIALVIAGIGLLTIIAGIVVFIKSVERTREDNRIAEDEIYQAEQEIKEEAELISDNEEKIRDQLWKYKVHYDSSTTGSDLSRLLRDSGEYEQLQKKQELYKQGKSKMDDILANAEYVKYLSEMGIESSWDNYIDDLYRLESDYKEYCSLEKKNREYAENKDQFEKVSDEATRGFEELGLSIEDGEEGLARIRKIATEYQGDAEQLKRIEEELKSFEQENAESIEAIRAFDIEAVTEDYETINSEYNRIAKEREDNRENRHKKEKTLEDLKRQEEEKDILIEKCQILKEVMEKKASDYALLNKAAEHMGVAKHAMMAKYVTPVQKVFEDIYRKALGETGEKYNIDAKANITVEELGMPRETVQLSTGYQDFIGLLFRLAMIEVMYKGEKPVLVMDDPFACMDELHLKGAKELLDYIGKDYQVLYFTCTDAREV